MRKIHQSIAVLVLALVGLAGCDQEQRAVRDTNSARVAEMQQTHRNLWLGHIILIQHVVLFNTAKDPAARDTADKQVLANAKPSGRAPSHCNTSRLRHSSRERSSGMTSQIRVFSSVTIRGSIINRPSDSKLFTCSEPGDERRQLCYRI